MATTQSDLQLLLSKGPLSSLWNNKTLTTTIDKNNGQLYIGLDDTTNRAMLFIDDNNKRYVFTADVQWNDLRNIPENLVYQPAVTDLINKINEKVSIDGSSIMTGPLNISAAAGENQPKVSLTYRADIESLDFVFT